MPEAEVTVVRGSAMGFDDIPVVTARVPERSVSAVASLPVMPRAVQLTVSGGPDDAEEVSRVARAVMRSFQARSNWLTAEQMLRRRLAQGLLGGAWVLVLGYAAAWALRFRRRAAPGPGQIVWLIACAAGFFAAAGLLAALPAGATSFDPLTPVLVGAVVLANAVAAVWRRRAARGATAA